MSKTIEMLAMEAGVIPNQAQTLLLQACTWPGSAAIKAFNQWLKMVDLGLPRVMDENRVGLPQLYDHLDLGSQRLLSLLYKNLTNEGFSHPVIDKLAGYYKYVWYRNNLLKAKLDSLIRDFNEIGVEPVIIKGIVLIEKYYKDYGMRPTTDLDIFVRQPDMQKAVEMLIAKGWKSKASDPHRVTQSQTHAHTFCMDHVELDLHYRFSHFPFLRQTEQSIWDNSTSQKKGYRTLSPAHELFITMLHGCQWNFIPPIRWVADCVTLISHFDQKEWLKLGDLILSENFNIHGHLFHFLEKNGFVTIPTRVSAILKAKRADKKMERQIIYALSVRSENEFTNAIRVLHKSLYTHDPSVLNGLSAWVDHYLYLWDKKNSLYLIPKGVSKFVNKAYYTLRKSLVN
jgi:Uncharacterised nucleotidyltransferase